MNKDQALRVFLFILYIVSLEVGAILYMWLVFHFPLWKILAASQAFAILLALLALLLALSMGKVKIVKDRKGAGTKMKEPTEPEKEFALLNERLSRLEELYRSGEVEEEAYKRLKEEYEGRKRELEKKVGKQE